jgi:hypothetical protein
MMIRSISAVALLALTLPIVARAQMAMPAGGQMPAAPTGPAGETLASYNRLKPNIIKAAEKMPEENYQFKPTADERVFARVVNHVTEAQLQSCSTLTGDKFDKAQVPSDTASKADIVAGLKASFDECDKAYAALTDTNLTEMVAMGPRKRSRMALAWGNISHDNEQYAELSGYMRLKGINPPTAPEK